MNVSQAFLAGVYLLSLAKATSNQVGGDTSVAIITSGGIVMQDIEWIKTLEGHLKDYETQINRLFLACADFGVGESNLKERLEVFSKAVLLLREKHVRKISEIMRIDDEFGL
jgi:hypothetical protein